jgi:ribonuclease-3
VVERLYQARSSASTRKSRQGPEDRLQEILQGRHLPLPRYQLLATRGEAHAQEFEVECEVPELGVRSTGIGASRRIAEQQAAERAIAGIGK